MHSGRTGHKDIGTQGKAMKSIDVLKDVTRIELGQLHRMFTHEDAAFFHAHKFVGGLVLGHFLYRMILVWKYGHMFFGPNLGTLFWIIVHASLHITSFQFIIPKRRNRVYNIIWPEMRWHTAIFAWRSLALMLAMWLADRGMIQVSTLDVFRGPLVLTTMLCADVATWVHRTKDATTTMRDNPYPRYASPQFVTWNNMFYSASQILATLNILSKTRMEVPFMILLPIQTAPLGMTLVKKGIITQAGWHLWYTLALLSNYVHAFIVDPNVRAQLIPRYMYWSFFLGFSLLRFKYRVNKYTLWAGIIIFLTCMYHGIHTSTKT
jgi:hypothetical protein